MILENCPWTVYEILEGFILSTGGTPKGRSGLTLMVTPPAMI
jgi:hypothetical protein